MEQKSTAKQSTSASVNTEVVKTNQEDVTGTKQPAQARTGERRVKVLSGVLGGSPPLTEGQIVPASSLPDVEHLVEIGAVAYTDELEEPPPTLYDAMRSSSPPTLPNAPYVDATEHEKLAAAGALPPEAMEPGDVRRG